ncbi:MAG TPA: hypothetical protein EYO00_04065 [Gammaproteobacteria bacterium]|jgi:hypothetical protein|nr:hypothetical protein [Gammaproteobacteria bacterium]HIN89682.1 hypothetical protein [Porticoccaceae bacterium]
MVLHIETSCTALCYIHQGTSDQFNGRSAGVWRVLLQSGVRRQSFRSLLTLPAYIYVGDGHSPWLAGQRRSGARQALPEGA